MTTQLLGCVFVLVVALSLSVRGFAAEGVSNWKGNTLRKQLEDLGMLRQHKVNMGMRGKRITLTELTGRAYQVLEALEVKVKRPSGNGSYTHQFWQHTIHNWAVRKGYPVRIEESLGEKRVDVGVRWAEKCVAVEVVVERLDKELANLRKDLLDGWDQVIFCAEKQKTLDQLARMIDDEYGHELQHEGRVAFMRFKEFIE